MNPSFFTVNITDSCNSYNQLGESGSREFILRASLIHNDRLLTYRESQDLFDRADKAYENGTTTREVLGDVYIRIYPERDPVLYRYDDGQIQRMRFGAYAPEGLEIHYAPGHWVMLQKQPNSGGDTDYPENWNNINPHFEFESLLFPAHFGEIEHRVLSIAGDSDIYEQALREYSALRLQSVIRGRNARRHVQRIRREERQQRHLNDNRNTVQQYMQGIRARYRNTHSTNNPNLPELKNNLNIKF